MAKSTVNQIRTTLAEGFVENFSPDVFVAIGTGNADWDVEQIFTGAFAADPTNTLDVGDTNITSVVVKTTDEVTTYVEDTDYTVDLATGIVTRDAGGSIPDAGSVKVFYYLDRTPLVTQTDLIAELGRKRASVIGYATPDVGGSISVDTGNFNVSGTPTKYILIQVTFLDTEATGTTIREFGVYTNCVLNGGLPGGQVYFEPGDVTDVGDLNMVENVVAIDKDTVGEINKTFIVTL